MAHEFKTRKEAIEAGYTPVNRKSDKDTSGVGNFGYDFENNEGQQTVTVWFTEEKNQLGNNGCFIPMYPSK